MKPQCVILSEDRASFQAELFVHFSEYLLQEDKLEEDKQRERTLHLRNLQSIHDHYRLHGQDQYEEQVQAIQENGRLSPTKFDQVQEDIRM